MWLNFLYLKSFNFELKKNDYNVEFLRFYGSIVIKVIKIVYKYILEELKYGDRYENGYWYKLKVFDF